MKFCSVFVLVAALCVSDALVSDLIELRLLKSLLSGGSTGSGSIGSRSSAASSANAGGGGLNFLNIHYCKETPRIYKLQSCSDTKPCPMSGLLQCVGGMCCAKSYGSLQLID